MKPHLLPIRFYWIFFFLISNTQRPIPKDQSPTTKDQRPKPNTQRPKSNNQRPIPKAQFPKPKHQRPKSKDQSPKTKTQRPNPHLPQSKSILTRFYCLFFCPYKNHCNCRSYNTHNQSANCTVYRIVLVIEISLRLRCCFVIA